MRRFVSFLVAVSMLFSSVNGYAQSVALPQPGTMISLSGAFAPVMLKGMVIHPEDPLVFDFVVDNGNTGLKDAALTDETTRLVKYFLAGIAIPEKDLWVNLSPLEKDRIIEEGLSQTDMGRDMLAQDYMLKQMVSSLIYPESDLGREFWSKVYAQAQEKFGSTEVPVDTFNKVWIMPETATVYRDGNKVMIADARLKVLMEKDYLAMQQGQANAESADLSTTLMREIVIPVLEKEVNEGKNFVQIRQLFHSLILANYYKNALKQSLLAQIYADSKKTNGIDIADPARQVETIYGQYVEAFKTGVFNYIKEDIDQVSGESVPHKYFSGGAVMKMNVDEAQLDRVRPAVGDAAMIEYRLTPSGSDAAQRVSAKSVQIMDAAWKNQDDVTYTTNYGPVRIWREGKGKIIGQKGRGPQYVFQDRSSMSFLTRQGASPQTAVARIINGDAAMRGDADGVVQALYERIPENRRAALEKITPEKVAEVRGQIAEAVGKLRSMIDFKGAKGQVPSDEEIMDSLVDTNAFYPALFDRDFTAKLGDAAVPPTFVFDGSVLTTYPGKKKPQVMAITVGDGYFAATATSVNLPNYKKYGVWKKKGLLSPSFDLKRFLLAKGGVRIYQLGKNLKGTLEDKLRGNGTKPLAEEVSDLAFGMSGKVPAEILFEGGKTTIVLDEAADPSKVIRSWTRSSILAGVLGRLYDAGPDMGSADLMGDLQEEANIVHGLLGLPQIPVTTSIAGEIASFDHFKWTVTSISAFESFMVIFQDPWIRARYGIKDKVDLVIQGFGDVGSGLVKYISEKYGSLLDNGTIRFVAVSDITGGIYDPQGLDVKELLRLRDLEPKKLSVKRDYVVPSGHKVETFEKGTDVFFVRKNGSDPERSGIAFPAAGPGVFQTREDVERLKTSGVDVLVSPANNVLKENIGLEAVLEEMKVLYLSASSVSHGGIQTSSEEIFHIVYEGLESLRAKVASDEAGWKSHIQDGIIGLTQSLITWEVEKFKAAIKRGENVTFHGIHMGLAEQIQAEKDFLLSLPPTSIFDRLNEEVRAVWAQYEEQGQMLTADQRDAVSLIIILNRIVEESRTFAMYAWKDRNNIVKARLATLEKMLDNPSAVSLVDQKIAAYELGRFAATEAKEDLRRVLVDPRFDPIVRGFAAEAFVAIGDAQDVPFLQEVARNAKSAQVWDISFAANLAVERITAIAKTKTADAAMNGIPDEEEGSDMGDMAQKVTTEELLARDATLRVAGDADKIRNWVSPHGVPLNKILNGVIKEYDIRGYDGGDDQTFPTQIDGELWKWFGRALGSAPYFSERHQRTVDLQPGDFFLVAGDNGPSTGGLGVVMDKQGKALPSVIDSMSSGFMDAGINVINLNVVGSGALYSTVSALMEELKKDPEKLRMSLKDAGISLTDEEFDGLKRIKGGVYVTRSHVEVGTNGAKPNIDGITLYGDMLQAMKPYIENGVYREVPAQKRGKTIKNDWVRETALNVYERSIQEQFGDLRASLDEVARLAEEAGKPAPKVVVNLSGGSLAATERANGEKYYPKLFREVLGGHLKDVLRSDGDSWNENGGLADPTRLDAKALGHEKANVTQYSKDHPDEIVVNFDLDADRISIMQAGRLFLGDEMFYPVIEYQLTLDPYADIHRTQVPIYFDSRMKSEFAFKVRKHGGIAKIHPKGHSKVKATIDVTFKKLVDEWAAATGNPAAKEAFLAAHPGFKIVQAEYSTHMFMTDTRGNAFDDAVRFGLFWLQAFAKIQVAKHKAMTMAEYIQADKDDQTDPLPDSKQLKEQRTSVSYIDGQGKIVPVSDEQKKALIYRMTDKVKAYFASRPSEFDHIPDWQQYEGNKKPFTLVEVEGVYHLFINKPGVAGEIFWGWSNTSNKVAFGTQSADGVVNKKLAAIAVKLLVESRQEMASETGLNWIKIEDLETKALSDLFGGLKAQEIESAVTAEYADSTAALDTLTASQTADAAMTRREGGIDLRNSDFLKTMDKDASGMPVFDPAQVQILKQDLRGFIPVPVSAPQPLSFRTFLGLSEGPSSTRSASTAVPPDQTFGLSKKRFTEDTGDEV